MPFYLSKSERRALLLISLIIITAILLEWFKPHQIHKKIYDYSLQDSLFRALSAQSAASTENVAKESTALTAVSPFTQYRKKNRPLQSKSININRAKKEELTRLPRIGPKIAERIIAYRKLNGPFKTIDEIKEVKGIGDKTFQKLAPFITTH